MSDNALQTILSALRNVEADQVTITLDSSGKRIAKVLLHEDQLEEAMREDGRYVREAAMSTGVRIHVELAKGDERLAPWWKFWR